MANNEKTIAISTIPIPKLTVLMNNFICNTITHLNKLSVKGDEKLAEFDKKLNDLEIMTTLLESKLNSLPEKITSTYPQLQQCNLDDVNPIIIANPVSSSNVDEASGAGSGGPEVPPSTYPNLDEPPKDNQNIEDKQPKDGEGEGGEGGEGEGEGGDPAENLENFLKSHESFRNLYKMIKLHVPLMGVRQKAKINGLDMDVLEELIDKARKVDPSIG
jgi:hypothetical protein